MSKSLEHLKLRDNREFHYEIEASDLVSESCCPMCDSESLETISDVSVIDGIRFFETSVCTSCSFVFRSLFPGFAWFKDRWAQISTRSGNVFNPQLEDDRRVRYTAYLDLLVPHVIPGGRVLDIGGGYGTGVSVFRDAGFKAELLEPEDDRIFYAKTELGLTTHHTVLEEFEPDGTYDLILWSHNLEHVDGPRASFERVASLLTPDAGILYVEVPLARNIIDWSDSLFMAHKSNFAEGHLKQMLRSNSLSPIHRWYPKLNSPIFEDIGIVARATSSAESAIELLEEETDEARLDEIHQRYLRMMPCDLPDRTPRPLHFEVPFINHFYTTVRYTDGRFECEANTGCIRFVAP